MLTQLEQQLHQAVKDDYYPLVRRLLDQHVNPDCLDEDGLSPIAYAQSDQIRAMLKVQSEPDRLIEQFYGMKLVFIGVAVGLIYLYK